jgi:hypothetical protein
MRGIVDGAHVCGMAHQAGARPACCREPLIHRMIGFSRKSRIFDVGQSPLLDVRLAS